MSFASDEFSRWDAGQTLFNKYLVKNVKALQQNKPLSLPTIFIDGFKSVLVSEDLILH